MVKVIKMFIKNTSQYIDPKIIATKLNNKLNIKQYRPNSYQPNIYTKRCQLGEIIHTTKFFIYDCRLFNKKRLVKNSLNA